MSLEILAGNTNLKDISGENIEDAWEEYIEKKNRELENDSNEKKNISEQTTKDIRWTKWETVMYKFQGLW